MPSQTPYFSARCEIGRLSGTNIARISVALALTGFVVWRSDPSAVAASAVGADAAWLVLAVGLVLLDRSLMAYRWVVLVRVFDGPAQLPLAALLRVFFVSTFAGTFLPTSIGGDAVRAYGLARLQTTGASSVASVLMDRLLGVVSLLIVALAGLAFARDLLQDVTVVTAVVVTAGACAAALSAVYSERVASVFGRVFAALPFAAAPRIAGALVVAVRAYGTRHGALANVLAGSITVQLVRIVQAYALGRSIGMTVPLTIYVAFIPVILLVMLLPISFHGLGPSQLAFAALFARVGVPSSEAIALSLLFVGLGVVGNLPGAFLSATAVRKPEEAGG